MKFRDILLVLAAILIWGLNFSIVKFGLDELPPILFSAVRFSIIAIPAVFFIPFPKTSLWNIIGVGVFLGIIKYSLLFIAMKADASAGLSSLILQTQVFFTIGLSILFFKEKINKAQLFGIVIALIGFSLFFINSGGNITQYGLILILLAALSWSISNLIMKQINDINLIHFIIWISLIPPIPLFILSYFLESQDPVGLILATTAKGWGSLLFASYISMLLAFAIWAWLMKAYSAAVVTPFALLIPVVGIIASSIILGESLTPLELLATSLIMLGLFLCALGNRIMRFLLGRSRHG